MMIFMLVLTVAVSPTSAAQDRKAPTTPTNLRVTGMTAYSVSLAWNPSTDNLDPQSVIRSDVYVNGVLDHSLLGYTSTVVYGNAGVFNTFQVIAVDSAGNQSAPATLTTCAGTFC